MVYPMTSTSHEGAPPDDKARNKTNFTLSRIIRTDFDLSFICICLNLVNQPNLGVVYARAETIFDKLK